MADLVKPDFFICDTLEKFYLRFSLENAYYEVTSAYYEVTYIIKEICIL